MIDEEDCIRALREAAEELGPSFSKGKYEELGGTPASASVIRVFGTWNEAKERAGLETNPSTGSRLGPMPEDVELPEGESWGDLSVDQRWHYRNVRWNADRTLTRRASLRKWVNEYKESAGCQSCGIDDPACLDLHHVEEEQKVKAIGKMITAGFGKDALRQEIDKCEVLCANCHKLHHWNGPPTAPEYSDESNRFQVRRWIHRYKLESGGCSRCSEWRPACLEFHHFSEDKHASIGKLVSDRRPLGDIRSEVEKCVLLCANCHRKEHFEIPHARD